MRFVPAGTSSSLPSIVSVGIIYQGAGTRAVARPHPAGTSHAPIPAAVVSRIRRSRPPAPRRNVALAHVPGSRESGSFGDERFELGAELLDVRDVRAHGAVIKRTDRRGGTPPGPVDARL